MTNMMRLKLPLFVASLWLALATALLSSLIPGGLPRTTVLGSAFHPSTTAVALQPSRIQPRATVVTMRRDDGQASGQGSGVAIAHQSLVFWFPTPARGRENPAVPVRPLLSLHAVVDGNPRAPPLT